MSVHPLVMPIPRMEIECRSFAWRTPVSLFFSTTKSYDVWAEPTPRSLVATSAASFPVTRVAGVSPVVKVHAPHTLATTEFKSRRIVDRRGESALATTRREP